MVDPLPRKSVELQPELPTDPGRLLVSIDQDLRRLLGRRRKRKRASLLDHFAVFGQLHDRRDVTIEQRDDGLRGSRPGAVAQPDEPDERKPALAQGWRVRSSREPLRTGDREDLELAGLLL